MTTTPVDSELCAAAFDAMGAAAAVLDGTGRIVAVNRAWTVFAEVNGGDPARTGVGCNYVDVCRTSSDAGVDEAADIADAVEAVLAGRLGHAEFEYPCPSPEEDRWFLLQAAPLPGGGAVVSHVNISWRKRLEERLAHLAVHDPLTGLPNRAMLEERLRVVIARTTRHRSVAAVLFCDLDGFKAVNDRYGHASGDELLVQVAARLVRMLRVHDSVSRLAGDEFVVVCEDLDGPEQADEIAARIERVLALPFLLGPHQVSVGASVGSTVVRPGDDPEALLERSDMSMYERKRRRRG